MAVKTGSNYVGRVSEPALFRAFPSLIGHIPWLSLGRFPTRVERIKGLTSDAVELWVKRDDESGVTYGGNKVRKLEFLLGEARARGVTRLLTLGGIGSHHVLATAIYGRAAGFAVEAVVFPQPLNDHVRQQLRADAAVGAQLVPTRGYAGVPLAVWRRRRGGVAWIAPGGSSATGTLGYVAGALEILEQVARGALPPPQHVYVALGSGGTAAGLLLGLRGAPSLPSLAAEIVAVRVVDRLVANGRATRRLAAATEALLCQASDDVRQWFNHWHREKLRSSTENWQMLNQSLRVEHGFFGGAYGRPTPAAQAAVVRAAAVGLHLEPTYTGKAMAALLADADAGRLDGRRVLFVDTFNSVDLAPLLATPSGARALPPRLQRLVDAGATGDKD
jgi:1-aminocyclopropane-1-carboxylate deaminase/D-cysteine desulfhydrase-like pyridoxal-dependent ACC family enzyme